MRKLFVLTFSLALLAACTPATPAETATPAPDVNAISTQVVATIMAGATQTAVAKPTPTPVGWQQFNTDMARVTLTIPAGLASSAASAIGQADLRKEVTYNYPQHVAISFTSYADANGPQPLIRIFRKSETQALKNFSPGFHSNAEYFTYQTGSLTFQNGKGEFSLLYGTDKGVLLAPINNHDLEYYFLGETNDGQYVIAARFPLETPWLISKAAFNEPDLQIGSLAFPSATERVIPLSNDAITQITFYNRAAEEALKTAKPGDFTPNLDLLNRLIQSMRVDAP